MNPIGQSSYCNMKCWITFVWWSKLNDFQVGRDHRAILVGMPLFEAARCSTLRREQLYLEATFKAQVVSSRWSPLVRVISLQLLLIRVRLQKKTWSCGILPTQNGIKIFLTQCLVFHGRQDLEHQSSQKIWSASKNQPKQQQRKHGQQQRVVNRNNRNNNNGSNNNNNGSVT